MFPQSTCLPSCLQRTAGVISPSEVLIVTCPQDHCEGQHDWGVGDNTAFYVSGAWASEVHSEQLAGAGSAPSSGFMAITVALAIAKDLGATVDVYGFGGCPRCGKYFVRLHLDY